MRAVNLIPSDQRRRASGGGTGVGSYIVLGVLALVVAAGAAYALTSRSVTDRRDELARIQAQTKLANADAQALQAYTSFADLRQKRDETVRSLAVSRFDWSTALREVARTIPANAWLTGMRATVTPSTTVEGGVTDPLRASMQVPAIELTGCTTSQDKVAGVIASLRRVHGIQRVSLSSSEKLDAGSASAATSAAGAGGKSGSDDCRNGNTHLPKFSMTLFFEPTSGSTTGSQPTAKEKTP
jgi:Tfp pilus assembly protein PilN